MIDLPRIVLPDKLALESKFIQVYANRQPFFRSGDENSLHIQKHLDDLAQYLPQGIKITIGGSY